jgi:signal transduction histidine kinase
VYFSAEQELPPLGNGKPIILFRMIQEIINNIIKHAGADKINFSVFHKKNNTIIEIKDNGKGFDKETTAAGSGLNNLTTRSKMINAGIHINSSPGEGTHVIISVNDENNV